MFDAVTRMMNRVWLSDIRIAIAHASSPANRQQIQIDEHKQAQLRLCRRTERVADGQNNNCVQRL
jgi:hypothetical protein